MKDYNHFDIEKKWQKKWSAKKAYRTSNNSKKKKYYVLDMFPYPSGTGLHVGHPKGYIGSDVFARFKRMQGLNVLHPMGYDAFGLPAEQYALEHNINPRKAVLENVKTFEKQLSNIGLSYDWDRRVNTTDPEFYRWTQWIFLKIYGSWYNKDKDKAEPIETLVKRFEKDGNKNINAVTDNSSEFSAAEWKLMSEKDKQDMLMKYRLAYEGFSEVNWSPKLGTVLANDEIVDGPNGPVSERGGFPVEKKKMRQWFLRITAYAERLITGLDTIDWSSHIKEIEKNWIGKSEGSEINFEIDFENGGKKGLIPVFTTRPDTLFGATYVVLSPEHLWVTLALDDRHIGVLNNADQVRAYIQSIKNKSKEDRIANKEKTGVELKGVKAINPANGEALPIWIADYVLADYGTGAIMAVPAHDERDFEFATKFGLPIKEVILPKDREHTELPILGDGFLINSDKFNGASSELSKKEITKFVKGKLVTKYKMRDAVFARQRYWGEPIPLQHDKNGIIKPVSDKKLPLKLPEVKSYMPTGTGESPLAGVSSWVKAGFETNTMPGWAGSSWYFLRYMDPKNKKAFADKKAIKYWKNVDMYVGGAEHATGHLLYSRFWHKFLKDYGLVPTEEPFQVLKNQGMILGPDNRKMSKRWGNVVNPDDVVKNYGADTLRVYEMFMGPFEASLPWSTDNIIGSRRFLDRIWRLTDKVSKKAKSTSTFTAQLHRTIQKVTLDIETFSFNTAVSSMMILLNEMEKLENVKQEDFEIFLKLLNPFAPHMTEELWAVLGHKSLLVLEKWPKADTRKMVELDVKIIIQINGKVRAEAVLPRDLDENKVFLKVKNLPDVEKWMIEKKVVKVIYVKNKLINIVVA